MKMQRKNSKFISIDRGDQVKRTKNEIWIQLISSDWFAYFLDFLHIDELVKLDLAFCNHSMRQTWLGLVRQCRPCIRVNSTDKGDSFVEWLILRGIQPLTVFFDYTSFETKIPQESARQLTKNCSN